MRLTLRTMLAYLDDILDPNDAESLGRKIKASEFATDLVKRIQTVGRRPKLGVPAVDGKGMGADPNTVAEYLDNTLPPNRVPDMEKVCLESDVHLAEVAACHQILTIVLGKPAKIGPALRNQAYRIGAPNSDRIADTPETEAMGEQGQADQDYPLNEPSLAAPPLEKPPLDVTPRSTKKAHELPEYLRIGRRTAWKPLVITLAVAFILSAVALRAMGPFDASHPLMRLFGGAAPIEVTQNEPETTSTGSSADSSRNALPARDVMDPSPGSGVTGSVSEAEQPAAIAGAESPHHGGAAESVADSGTQAEQWVEPPQSSPGADQAALPPSDRIPLENQGSSGGLTVADDFPPTSPSTAGMSPTPGVVVRDGSASATIGDVPAPAADSPPAPVSGVKAGFVKPVDRQSLCKLDPRTGEWIRSQTRDQLVSGDRLLVLPTFRPEVQLLPAVQVSFAGPTVAECLPPTEQGEPGLRVDYGRMFLATAGVANARMHLDLAGFRAVVTFVDAASEIAVEVRRYLPPGLHPEHDVARRVIEVYATAGEVAWQIEGAANAIPIRSGQVRVIVDENAETLTFTEAPAWVRREDLRDVDRLASETLEPSLVVGRPISLSLRERVEDRKSEVRSLAARCLAYLEIYGPLIDELNDERQRAFWISEVDVLMQSLARTVESAEAIRVALEGEWNADAEDIYRLMWGFSPQQLQDEWSAKLVDLLDHPNLPVRVLAFENLRRITGQTQLYRPEVPESRRRSSINQWREVLQRGEIAYKTPPVAYHVR